MGEISGFSELADELQELANAFDRVQSRKGTDLDAHGAIEQGTANALEEEVVPEAKRRARQYVTNDAAESIDQEPGVWQGDRYRHYFYATDDLVRYHEFGTGAKADGSGTVNAVSETGQPGYIIRPNGDYPLGIPSERWDGPSEFVNDKTGKVHLEYVVHPGVEAQHFMRRSLDRNANELRGYILAQITKMYRKNGLL